MSKAKFFGLVLGMILGAVSMARASTSPNKISDELYSDDLYRAHAAQEIPQSLEASASDSPLAQADITASPAIESVADVDSAPVKKKGKNVRKRASF